MADRKALIIIAVLVVIIAVIAVLALSLYIPTASKVTSPICVATVGYTCSSPVLYNGTLTALIGQSTGTQWVQANIFFVIAGSPTPTAVPPLPCEQGVSTSWPSGGTVNVTLNDYSNSNTCAGFPKTAGQSFTGTVWVGYRTSLNGEEQIVQIGTISVASS